MHPVADTDLTETIPEGATFWTPKPSEIDEEGFGFFRDVTDLRGTTAADARGFLAAHVRVFNFIDSRASTVEDFDGYASAFENDSAEDDGLTGEIGTEIDDFIDAEDCYLGNLELGVGALAYVLSAAKMFPAASCRSHTGTMSWSPFPVVYVAASAQRAELLQKLVRESGCGFTEDPARSELLVIGSCSIPPMLVLTEKIVENLSEFRSLTSRKNASRKPANPYTQQQLF